MGNRQGGKVITRHELEYPPKNKKTMGKIGDGSNVDADPLSPQFHVPDSQSIILHSAITARTSPSSALPPECGGGSNYDNGSNPNFVSKICIEEKHLTSCLSAEPFTAEDVTAVDGMIISDVSCAHKNVISPSTIRTEVSNSSHTQTQQDLTQEAFVSSPVPSDVSLSIPFPGSGCVVVEPVTKVNGGVSSLADVTNTTALCIERLEKLKRNIEQSNTEKLTYFNNTGFAQLQAEADYDNTENENSDESEAFSYQRGHSMSPKTAVSIDVPQRDVQGNRRGVRKLSEPFQFFHRKDSMSSKTLLPGAWSRSAENSPIIVRKALPSPGSPVIVQRTPSQSPSVERRFPANASASPLSGRGAELLDSSKSGHCVYQKVLSKNQSCLGASEVSHSVCQQPATEISLPLISSSPVSFRKMPASPILFSRMTDLQGMTENEYSSNRTANDYNSPSAKTSRLHQKRGQAPSSCSSSSSESQNGKLPSPAESIPLSIPVYAGPTSSVCPAPCSSFPTPIQFCSQPRGIPVKQCITVSQPSTAVVLAAGESHENLPPVQVAVQTSVDTLTAGEGPQVQMKDSTKAEDNSAFPHKQSKAVVTEDSIKEQSQSAVFGSVSPKLLRHRRLTEGSHKASQSQQAFSKQSRSIRIATTKIFSRNWENAMSEFGDSDCTDRCMHVAMEGRERVAEISKSAPSSFSSQRNFYNISSKTLGQRIREVINESRVGTSLNRNVFSLSFGKQEKIFSKESICTSTGALEKSSSHSFPRHLTSTNGKGFCEKIMSSQKMNPVDLAEGRSEEKATEKLRTLPSVSRAGTTHTVSESHPFYTEGHSRHINSSRDSCSSCVSDTYHADSAENPGCQRQAGGLTQTHLFSDGAESNLHHVLATRLGVPGQRLSPSDTTDTLSTDRDTSGSSKRESSTSTATDDTLTSFKTRSTADSAEYEEPFVLPESLVFIRSADKDGNHDVWGFDSEQTTIKRKLVQRQVPEPRAGCEHLQQKTRKKRRKQSQHLPVRREHKEGTLKRNHSACNMSSDDISDDSDLFSSRDDISDLHSSRDDFSDLPSSRDDITDFPSRSGRCNISALCSRRDNALDIPSDRNKISGCFHTSNDPGEQGVIHRRVFHRSDLSPSAAPQHSGQDRGRPTTRRSTPHEDRFTDFSDNYVDCALKGTSHGFSETFVSSSKTACGAGDPKTLLQDPPGVIPNPLPEATRPDLHLCTRSPSVGQRKRLTTTLPGRTSHVIKIVKGHDSCQQSEGKSVRSSDDEENKGKELLLQRFGSPESTNTIVLSCTIYNSARQGSDAPD